MPRTAQTNPTRYCLIEGLPATVRQELEDVAATLGSQRRAFAAILRATAHPPDVRDSPRPVGGWLAQAIRAGQIVDAYDREQTADLGIRVPVDHAEILKAGADHAGVKVKAAARFVLVARAGQLLETATAGLGVSLPPQETEDGEATNGGD